MKILIILPDGRIHKLKIGRFINISFREAPLTATMLAALVPTDLNADIKIVDESVSSIPFNSTFDLVAISCLTGTAPRAYEIADQFKAKGATVVLGGVHVTLMPNEARKHADAIVCGFAETTWPELLRDFQKGELKPEYHSKNGSIDKLPMPRRDLQKRLGYGIPNTIFATRGCRSKCDFCSVPAANFGWKTRPVAEVIDEIKQIKARRIAFNDVNLTDDTDYAKELLTAMIPLRKTWGGLASTLIANDDELLDLLQQSGCNFLLLGFESINEGALSGMRKGFNKVENYHEIIRKLHNKNIIIQGCFIFGLDSDDKSVFANTVDFVNQTQIDIPRYAIYTPYPQTESFKRLDNQKRILHRKWEYYDTQHVVFQPKQMTPYELDNGFKCAYYQTFKIGSSLRRTIGKGRNFPISFAGNLAYKIYLRRLKQDKNRFPDSI